MASVPMSSAVERTLFIGPRIPNHIKSLPKYLSTIKRPVFRQLVKYVLKVAVLDFEGKNISHEMYQSLKKTVDNSNIDIAYGALYVLLKCALSLPESSLKQEIFRDDLRELKIPEEYIDDLASVVYGPRRSDILVNSCISAPHLPNLKRFRWRVDVAISTSTLNRVLEPAIVMEIELSDGRKETFEVHPTQFHRLRFAVATLLKEMENLEMRNVLKL